MGITEPEFWRMSFAQLRRRVEAYHRREKREWEGRRDIQFLGLACMTAEIMSGLGAMIVGGEKNPWRDLQPIRLYEAWTGKEGGRNPEAARASSDAVFQERWDAAMERSNQRRARERYPVLKSR